MADSFNGPALAPPASTKNQSQTSSPTLTLSIGIGNTSPVPGFPSPSSSFVPPPVVTPIEFATVKDKRKDENSRKNSKTGLVNVATKSKSQLDTKPNTSASAVDPNSIISPTTPTPNGLHRQRSFPNSESFSEVAATVIELPTELPTDDETHNSSSNSAAKAFGAAASRDTQSPIIPTPPFSKQSLNASHSLPKTPVRTPSNPPTPSSPGFHFPPSASSRKPNRDSTMSNFSTSSAASTRSTTSLKSNRPAPPSPALSRRTSGTGVGAATSPIAKRFSAGPGGIPAFGVVERSHSLRTSPTVSRNHSNSPKAALPMSSHPHRFSSPAFRRDSSTMSVPAPLPLTPVPGSATLPPVSASLLSGDLSSAGLSSAGLSSAALRTATTASTALTKGKGTGTASQMRRPIRIRDYAYVPREDESLDADARPLWENDPQFLGFGADGKGLHVPTPNRVKVLNKALLTATNLSTISSNLNTAYTMWKTSYKRDRKERKAAVKRRAKETKRERAQARYSMNSVRSVGSTSSTASSVSSTSSRSEVDEVDEREDDDEDDGMGGWAGFRFGLARLSWGFGNSGASGSTGTSVSTSTPASKIATNTPNEPSASNTSNNSNSGPSSNAFPSRLDLDRNFGIDATSSESGDESSNNSTDTEGEQFHDAPSSHLRHADLDFGLDLEGRGIDSPSPLDYDRVYGYDEDAYGQIPNSAFPSASPYPGSGDGYGYEDDSLDSIGEGELIPGQYRALYSFEPEGPSEMKLTEGEIVMVVGRGGGGGWAVVVDKYTEYSPRDVEPGGTTNPNVTSKYALVPESYLELIQPDEVADREVKKEKGTVTTPEVRQ
ncbi:hypothetical protein HHX47_DHR2000219 [Lentinula edodes]|nr:hypothetical protein HHX47_DHR2000219 [Lentinula edodes]KAJ3919541.1 hypothetical protein F5877DRAFT_77944 [Lentinula edodes]